MNFKNPNMFSEITRKKLLPHFPGTNELIAIAAKTDTCPTNKIFTKFQVWLP